VIENPAAGGPGYRGQPAFLDRCNELRAALAAVSGEGEHAQA
jgi:hypothetical protein